MNLGLLSKTLHETVRTTLLFGLALVAFEIVISVVIPSFKDQLAGTLLSNPFFRKFVQGLLGTTLGQNFGPTALYAMGWVHPVALSLLWAHEVMFCTRVPVAELERGTGDVLFALPVTRWQVYLTESVACLGSGAFLVACMLFGHYLSHQGADAPGLGRLCIAAVNVYAVYFAVAGLALGVSAVSRRRSRAIGVVFAIILVSFFLGFLTQFWAAAKAVSWIGLLHYYQPMQIFHAGEWPWLDLLALFGFGAGCWLLGGLALARRDL